MTNKHQPKIALGVMSGTSVDGIDLALIETDGKSLIRNFGNAVFPMEDALRGKILRAIYEKIAEPSQLVELNNQLSAAYEQAILAFLKMQPVKPDIIGLHGQTILHNPKARMTLQLSDGAKLAKNLGIDVVDQFRLNDVQSGGEGAPLAPIYHQALAKDMELPVVFVNFGGVANVTYIDNNAILAMDTGPASALIDDYMKEKFQQDYDAGGENALRGKPDYSVISQFMNMPYFHLPPPKSLDRQHFDEVSNAVRALENPYDALATLSEFTIRALLWAQNDFPQKPKRWIIMGGGRHNQYFIQKLKENTEGEICLSEDFGWNGDAIEAELMAFLAVRCLYEMPISFPSTTRAPKPLTGGVYHRTK